MRLPVDRSITVPAGWGVRSPEGAFDALRFDAVPIPDFQSIMRPLLVVLADGQDKTVRTIRDALAQRFDLTEEELEERLPSGRDRTYRNRVGWAVTHLKGAAVVESPRRGVIASPTAGAASSRLHPKRSA
jgi:restriction system protein